MKQFEALVWQHALVPKPLHLRDREREDAAGEHGRAGDDGGACKGMAGEAGVHGHGEEGYAVGHLVIGRRLAR